MGQLVLVMAVIVERHTVRIRMSLQMALLSLSLANDAASHVQLDGVVHTAPATSLFVRRRM